MIEVKEAYLSVMLISSVRYALGRSTYITDEVPDIVRRYIGLCDDNTRDVIIASLRDFMCRVEIRSKMGDGWQPDMVDLNSWKSLMRDIEGKT